MKNYENFARFRRDPKLKLHFSSFGPNWPLGPVKIPVKQAFFTGIKKSFKMLQVQGLLKSRYHAFKPLLLQVQGLLKSKYHAFKPLLLQVLGLLKSRYHALKPSCNILSGPNSPDTPMGLDFIQDQTSFQQHNLKVVCRIGLLAGTNLFSVTSRNCPITVHNPCYHALLHGLFSRPKSP